MLVLTRRAGESVFIGEGIEITVQSVKGENVRLAISAPKEIPILRSELKEAREVNRQSSAAPAAAISALRAGIKTEKSAAAGAADLECATGRKQVHAVNGVSAAEHRKAASRRRSGA